MAGWNGSGGFTLTYSWTADAAAGIPITASRMDTQFAGISVQGFGNALTRDGQGQPTANLPMAGFKHTGAAAGVAGTDYVTMVQITSGTTTVGFGTTGTGALTVNTGDFNVVSGKIKATSGVFVQHSGGAPASAVGIGEAGQFGWDGSFFYVCVATNTWKRTALSTW